MIGFVGSKEEAKLAELIKQEDRAKAAKTLDRFKLPPVPKGFLRGYAIKVRPSEEPCEFGTLQVLEFEVSDTMEGPGVPVRMVGTYFSDPLREGALLDVPDPTPNVRPITPNSVFQSRDRKRQLRTFYPGRGETPARRSLMSGALVLALPAVIVIAIIVALKLLLR